MRYFVLLMALVLSSCSHDDSQVNNGWVIYDLHPLQGGCVMYYGEDGGFSIFNSNRLIKFVGYQGVSYYAVFYSFEDAYEFNYGEKEEGKVKVVDSCYKRRW